MTNRGHYPARYTGPDGLRRGTPITFATKTATEDWLARTRTDISRDQWNAAERGLVTLAEYLADWLDSRVELRPTTVALYRQLSRPLAAHRLRPGRPPPARRRPHHPELVRRWCAGLVADTHTAAVQKAATTSNEAAAAWSGLREGELFALRRRDGDNRHRHHPRRPHHDRAAAGIDFGPRKGDAGRRTVTLPAMVAVPLPDVPVTRAQRAALLARPTRAAGRPDLT